ncbi:class I SAM-dependent methyltransferase [Brevundimonas sp. FT23042]|uniref:class I SAM-dependent methyltransferase n=1 Tax=Brevundimonas sp. FT23042 TaxID=3393749 RepID=UPI003B589255
MLLKFLRSLGRINLLIEPTIRHYVVYARAWYWIRLRKKLRTLDSPDAVKVNVMHNMKSIWGVNNRMNLLTYPLSVIETLDAEAKILVIGPRNENDLLSLAGLGFKRENILGLDLISYSPAITLGDMHNIPFPAGHFDAVICGWTISYSTNPSLAASEMVRVTKPGGVLAIGVEYSTMGPADEKALLGYELQEFENIGRRLNSTHDFRNLFADSIDHVYFEHDAPRRISHTAQGLVDRVSNVAIIFSTKQGS